MPNPTKRRVVEVWSFDSFDRNLFVDILSRYSIADKGFVETKQQIEYFVSYCNDIGVKTIVVEQDYIDMGFLEDYTGYYVRCFADYRSKCTRLHFFNFNFTGRQFSNCLLGKGHKLKALMKQTGSYLGFIVIKPLPRTIIGRTCLQAYKEENRRYFVTRDYKVNLYGIELVVEKTLAFQEQDHAVSACATSALWSTFQSTSRIFDHRIPSPVEITKEALQRFPTAERGLPNSGLTDMQIANGIRSVGLDPVPFSIDHSRKEETIAIIQDITYAYLKCNIPILLGFEFKELPQSPCHAVAVTGFNLDLSKPLIPRGDTSFLLRSSRIDKIFVHDDGVGPFARMDLDPTDESRTTEGNHHKFSDAYLSSEWPDKDDETKKLYASPICMLVSVYHKIRIPYISALDSVISFDAWIDELAKKEFKLFSEKLEWDVYLTTVNRLKSEIEQSQLISGAYKKSFLLEPMPRFIWRATAYEKNQPVLDLLFDATDIDQGSFLTRTIEYDYGLQYSHVIREAAKKLEFKDMRKTDLLWVVLSWFKKT